MAVSRFWGRIFSKQLFYGGLGLLCTSCAQPLRKFKDRAIIPDSFEVQFPVDESGINYSNILYLGCGGLIIERNGEAVISDPFFSNQHIGQLIFPIRSNATMYAKWKAKVEASGLKHSVKAGVVAHTHYDHAMDIPVLLKEKYFPNMKVLYGNEYLPQMLVRFTSEGTVLHGLGENEIHAANSEKTDSTKWIKQSPSLWIMPISTIHAPHTKRRLFMNGRLKPDRFRKRLTAPYCRMGAFKWTTGTSLAYLIDFREGDSTVLRIFLQTSASSAPNGLPPKDLINNRPVDLAILCLASAHNVDDYPNYLLRNLHAKKLMLVHWEDFFRKPANDSDVKIIRLTDLDLVSERLHQHFEQLKDYVVMPKPGTLLKVLH